MKTALIIFVRKPELGKVKTRLAATIGIERALKVYKDLLVHTKSVTQNLPTDKFVFYHNEITKEDIWDNKSFNKILQAEGDLGFKMQEAFTAIFDKGYDKVLILGSDCFQLEEAILKDALHLLDQKDVVIGPANDGGYYLLGMKKMFPRFFKNKTWSSSEVYKETIADFKALNLSWASLPTLIDIDTEEDLLASQDFIK